MGKDDGEKGIAGIDDGALGAGAVGKADIVKHILGRGLQKALAADSGQIPSFQAQGALAAQPGKGQRHQPGQQKAHAAIKQLAACAADVHHCIAQLDAGESAAPHGAAQQRQQTHRHRTLENILFHTTLFSLFAATRYSANGRKCQGLSARCRMPPPVSRRGLKKIPFVFAYQRLFFMLSMSP